MELNKKFLFSSGLVLFTIIAIFILSHHAVDNTLSEEDLEYIPLYLNEVTPLPENPSYKEQLNFIIAVQHSVLTIAPKNYGIAFGELREPKELYLAKEGLCYDRSRVIEKILRYSGFKVRHISIYSRENTNSAIEALFTPKISSHAVTEVLTKNGWLIVDSNSPWVSIDINDQPISISDIKLSSENSLQISWNEEPPSNIYKKPFTYVFGLYSRHGKFYPPYNFLPDINYSEFIQNIL